MHIGLCCENEIAMQLYLPYVPGLRYLYLPRLSFLNRVRGYVLKICPREGWNLVLAKTGNGIFVRAKIVGVLSLDLIVNF